MNTGVKRVVDEDTADAFSAHVARGEIATASGRNERE
jgi:hypothetical protein